MQRCSGKANKMIYIYIHHKRDVKGHRHQGITVVTYINYCSYNIELSTKMPKNMSGISGEIIIIPVMGVIITV